MTSVNQQFQPHETRLHKAILIQRIVTASSFWNAGIHTVYIIYKNKKYVCKTMHKNKHT